MSGDIQHKEFSREEISQAAQELGFELPGTAEDCMNEAVGHINSAVVSMVKAGLVLMKARAEGLHMNFRLPIPAPDNAEGRESGSEIILSAHAESIPKTRSAGQPENTYFRAALEKYGIPFQRAYECMQMAGGYLRAPEHIRAGLLKTGKRKALMLTSIDPEVIREIEPENWDAVMTLPVKRLREMLRDAETRAAVLDNRVRELRESLPPDRTPPENPYGGDPLLYDIVRRINQMSEWTAHAVKAGTDALDMIYRLGEADSPKAAYRLAAASADVLERFSGLISTLGAMYGQITPELASEANRIASDRALRSMQKDNEMIRMHTGADARVPKKKKNNR